MYRSANVSEVVLNSFRERRLTEWLRLRELAAIFAPGAVTVHYYTGGEYDDQGSTYCTLESVSFEDEAGKTLYPIHQDEHEKALAIWDRLVEYEGLEPLTDEEREDPVAAIETFLWDNDLFRDAIDYEAGGDSLDLKYAPEKPKELYVFDRAA